MLRRNYARYTNDKPPCYLDCLLGFRAGHVCIKPYSVVGNNFQIVGLCKEGHDHALDARIVFGKTRELAASGRPIPTTARASCKDWRAFSR